MPPKQLLLFLVVFFCLPAYLEAQQWSGIIDPTRAIDWTKAGIPGGIPNRTAVCSTLNASSFGSGSSDATSAIQNALDSCASNQVVVLSAGTFRIDGSLTIPSDRVLRGAGPSKTILDLHGSTQGAINFGKGAHPSPGTSTSITGGAKQGSTSITVSGSGISTGNLLMISQPNQSYMTNVGSLGTCDWCDDGFPGDMNSGQIVEVTGVSGGTVTFRPPLYNTYTSATAFPYTAGATNAGLESLKVFANNTGYTTNIFMSGTSYSWIKNVESDFADGAHVWVYYGLGNEIRNSYFHDGFSHGPGGTDDQVNLGLKTSGTMLVNNIFFRQHVSVMLEWGAAGNVIAYNYSTGNYHESYLAWLISDFDFHGSHPWFNLFEGNIGIKFQPDSVWGSSSHNTVFRNWFLGSNQYVPPLNARGPLQPGSAQQETANAFAYTIDYLSQYNNLVGDVAGSPQLLLGGIINLVAAPLASTGACYRIGYNSDDDSPMSPNNAKSTIFMHGNYDCLTKTFVWDAAHPSHALPPSFFLAGKPSWFGGTPWPAIGPDVSGGTGPGGFAHKIPAQACFENSPKDGTGRPIFDPVSCYGQTTAGGPPPPPVDPPSNLKTIVH